MKKLNSVMMWLWIAVFTFGVFGLLAYMPYHAIQGYKAELSIRCLEHNIIVDDNEPYQVFMDSLNNKNISCPNIPVAAYKKGFGSKYSFNN